MPSRHLRSCANHDSTSARVSFPSWRRETSLDDFVLAAPAPGVPGTTTLEGCGRAAGSRRFLIYRTRCDPERFSREQLRQDRGLRVRFPRLRRDADRSLQFGECRTTATHREWIAALRRADLLTKVTECREEQGFR